jgi:hypothetical protein
MKTFRVGQQVYWIGFLTPAGIPELYVPLIGTVQALGTEHDGVISNVRVLWNDNPDHQGAWYDINNLILFPPDNCTKYNHNGSRCFVPCPVAEQIWKIAADLYDDRRMDDYYQAYRVYKNHVNECISKGG